jgi:hypothetical protein
MGIEEPSCFPFSFYRYPAINLHRRVDVPAGLGRLKKFAAFNERPLVCSSLRVCFLSYRGSSSRSSPRDIIDGT